MINPKVSIITVTFNAEKVLERTLRSIKKQDYNNIESIIIDGASTDGTLKIVEKYSDVVTKWISEKDNGLYDAMNKGISLATGDYVWFLNAGDTICKSDVLNYFFSKESFMRDVYYGETVIVDENGKQISDVQKIIADKISDNSADRQFRLCFNLKQMQYKNTETYYLVIENEDRKSMELLQREEFQIDIAFAMDEFDFFGGE